jgi:glutamyl-Q tRNA(Asp) synthetase
LHLGHVHAAWVAWHAARQAGGHFLVRLEDIDPQRCRPAFAAAALEDLEWLGLHWDGDVRVQSAHLAEYRATLASLATRGLAYPCFCSRADIARELAASAGAPHAHTPDGAPLYPGICRALPAMDVEARLRAGAPHAWRLNIAAALAALQPAGADLRFHEAASGWLPAEAAPFGDVVLGRRDAPASYHLCVTHDDALQGVTLVTRGLDLLPVTHLHVLLQAVMGWPTPAYAHHPLLLGTDGKRLSKRDGAVSVAALRADGYSKYQVLRHAGISVGAAGQ